MYPAIVYQIATGMNSDNEKSDKEKSDNDKGTE